MATNQTYRVLELLKMFNNGNVVCIDTLKSNYLWNCLSDKTIRRDLDVIREVFPESFQLVRNGTDGCYKAITTSMFNNFLDPKNLSLLVQTFNIAQRSNLLESIDIDEEDKIILQTKINDYKKIYEFKNKPFESKSGDYVLFKKIENAIYFKKYNIMSYAVDSTTTKVFEIKPYKIVFMNENFYLASEVVDSSFEFSIFRISKIIDLEDTNKTFHRDYEIERFISDMQTPFARYKRNYKSDLIEIILEVDSSKAFYFKNKNYLTSQQIYKELDNGNIQLSYMVTQELEIQDLVYKWLPYIKVISPKNFYETIMRQLEEYVGKNWLLDSVKDSVSALNNSSNCTINERHN